MLSAYEFQPLFRLFFLKLPLYMSSGFAIGSLLLFAGWAALGPLPQAAAAAAAAVERDVAASAAAGAGGLQAASKQCWNDIDFKKMERQLSISPVKSKTLIDRSWVKKYNPSYSPPPIYILKLKSKAYPGLKAVWKPHRPLSRKAAAVFAYRLSNALKLKLVPPTAFRSIEGEEGVLQLFVEAIPYDTEEWREAWRRLAPKRRAAAFAFYFILGYYDIKPEHILTGKRCRRLALIDNDSSLKPSFIAFGQWPYRGYRLSGGKYPILRFEDYSSFPLALARPFEASAAREVREMFPDMSDKALSYLIMRLPRSLSHSHNHELNTLSLGKALPIQTTEGKGAFRPRFVRWKNLYWIQDLRWPGLFIFSDAPPAAYSSSLIKALKGLNREALESFFPPINAERVLKDQHGARRLYTAQAFIKTQGQMAWLAAGALKRRDMLLKEASKSALRKKR